MSRIILQREPDERNRRRRRPATQFATGIGGGFPHGRGGGVWPWMSGKSAGAARVRPSFARNHIRVCRACLWNGISSCGMAPMWFHEPFEVA
ncbi:hypothetical protein SETIT_5G040500v2 [Setaria italica]|uniref:Uncharacterized protein n=1 Tax=Setaria italica TaxID=4555 RepID=A0A368R175_SETIT|nr:hypothetical protein SETIT_5G040500v2 [Setaria italica]